MRIPLVSWLSFLICYWTYLGIDISVASGQCLEDQLLLLLQLKNNLTSNAVNSSKLVSWSHSSDCCFWSGVVCDEKGRVIGLDLSQQNINGQISNSSSLFGLQYLQNLNLAYNNFSSVIPSGFHNLANLSHLNLSNAGFVGQIPIEISNLTRLVTLDISTLSYLEQSTLKLESPNLQMLTQNLNEIRELHLDGINISVSGNEWCHALSSLPNLQILSMSSCNLPGPVDSSLKILKNISVIRLGQNNLSAPVPEFFATFSNLTTLDLSSNGLSGWFPKEIFQVRTLISLDLSNNIGLHGSLPDFPENGSLQTLILSNTNFSGAIPASINNLRQLTRLELSRCQFNGALPDSTSKLSELTYVDLSQNNFTGPIPSFGMAKKLNYIDLSHNNLGGSISSTHFEGHAKLVNIDLRNNFLSGSIPSSLFALPSLKRIQLSNNLFHGQLDRFSNTSSSILEILDLSGNKLEGSIPVSTFDLGRLNVLQLSSNKFNGTIQLNRIGRLQNLTTLDLSNNNLSTDVSAAGGHQTSFPKMAEVNLASCKLREIPDFLKNQSRLISLDLSNNQIIGTIPRWIWQLDSLVQLNLSHNLLTNIEGPLQIVSERLSMLDLHANYLQGSLPAFPRLATYLDYSINNFSSVIPLDIGTYLSSSIFLSLSHNAFQGRIPRSICNTSYLQVLDLSHNKFSGIIPQCLTSSETLGVLNLGKNNISGIIPDEFQASCALQTLDLHGNNLHGPIPHSLANCTRLEVLDLRNNKLEDKFPCLLKNLSTLRVLILRENEFHGPIGCPKTSGIWKMLQIVDLAFNKFNGTLPGKCFTTWKAMMPSADQAASKLNHLHFTFFKFSQVYYQDQVTVTSKGVRMKLKKILTVFTSIDFSFNHFEGSIPEEMMNFKALYVLNLSHNALTGQIPSSIGKLKQLESLDLSFNHLSGEIPTPLATLSFLSVLNLSNNHLVGKIPTGTQLQSFEPYSFVGNERLCGPPLPINCSDSNSGDRSPPTNSEFDWQFVSAGAGFGVGAGLVVAPLVIWKRGRKWSNNSIDKILLVILPLVGLAYTPIYDDEEEENTEEQNSDMADNCDYSEEDNSDYLFSGGRYCVFCSKLDISKKKVIHDPRCTCYYSPTISGSCPSSDSYSS